MKTADIAQLVEHNVANVEVVGSNPTIRSKLDRYINKEGKI